MASAGVPVLLSFVAVIAGTALPSSCPDTSQDVTVPARQSQTLFGTIAEQWSLPMSGPRAGAGITWCRGAGRLFLIDQHGRELWQLDPDDPPGTIERVCWQMTDVGVPGPDIPWGIEWDEDSGCFWISQIDSSIQLGCWLMRYVWRDSAWVWGGGLSDSWKVGDAGNGGALQALWLAGFEKWPQTGSYFGVPVAESPCELNHIVRFDPHAKTCLGRLAEGNDLPERGITLIPWDSAYVLNCGPNTDQFTKRDSTGVWLQAVAAPTWPADWAVVVPDSIRAEDTVWAYCIQNSADNYLYKVSTGMTWLQLGSVGVAAPKTTAPRACGLSVRPSHFAVQVSVRCRIPERQAVRLTVCAADGRVVRTLRSGLHDPGWLRSVWDGRDDAGRVLESGVYHVRMAAGDAVAGSKVIKLE